MRQLWTGDTVDHWGEYYTVENARLFTEPADPIPVIWAAAGADSAVAAAEHGDGLWSTSPDADVVMAYRDAGGDGPVYGQVTLCWATDRAEAVKTALEVWPNAGNPGQLSQDLPTWTHFENVAELITEEIIADRVPCGPDVSPVVELVREYEDAGFDHIHFHQVGPDQRGFVDFWRSELSEALK
jgi:G6PDH family F420-dependent oxidoreductase